MTFHQSKLDALAKPRSKTATERAEKRKKNRKALRRSQEIALALHYHLRGKSMTQKEFSDKLGVSAVYVGKLLRGEENLTLETIVKLEEVIGEELMYIKKPYISATTVSKATILRFADNATKSEKYKEAGKLSDYYVFTDNCVA